MGAQALFPQGGSVTLDRLKILQLHSRIGLYDAILQPALFSIVPCGTFWLDLGNQIGVSAYLLMVAATYGIFAPRHLRKWWSGPYPYAVIYEIRTDEEDENVRNAREFCREFRRVREYAFDMRYHPQQSRRDVVIFTFAREHDAAKLKIFF